MNNRCILNGEAFTAKEILEMPYVNTALYSFPVKDIIKVIAQTQRKNVQNEIYLTDGMEYLAKKNKVQILKINDSKKMLTYSSKNELKEIDSILQR